mmetsp:Transcript_6021/g.9055  ORF Transcript_6021/g.9055 Transcript_6021/m.9055 type:complete len:306 (+) Transcript_6021:40-957(+)
MIPSHHHHCLSMSVVGFIVWLFFTLVHTITTNKLVQSFPFPLTTVSLQLFLGSSFLMFLSVIGFRRVPLNGVMPKPMDIFPTALCIPLLNVMMLKLTSLSSFFMLNCAISVVQNHNIFAATNRFKYAVLLMISLLAVKAKWSKLSEILPASLLTLAGLYFNFVQRFHAKGWRCPNLVKNTPALNPKILLFSAISALPLAFVFDGYELMHWLMKSNLSFGGVFARLLFGGISLVAMLEAKQFLQQINHSRRFERIEVLYFASCLIFVEAYDGKMMHPDIWFSFISLAAFLLIEHILRKKKQKVYLE